MSKPISKRLLVCSAAYYKVTGLSADRKPVYADAVNLSNVWYTKTIQATNSSNGKETSDAMTLFYDCVNSSPADFEFALNDKVVLDNRDYFVNSISPCYADSGLHHYEIGLR